MNLRHLYQRRSIIVGAIIFFVLLFGAFVFLNEYIYQEKQGEGVTPEPYEATLRGEYVCLPHVDESGPHTLECRFGLKTEVGEYYAIDFGHTPSQQDDFSTGETVEAKGIITPVEFLSSDAWRQYPIEGVFSPNDSL